MTIRFHGRTNPVGDQRGSALIVAILLLAVMSILGLILMSTATTEIQLSGNYRNSQESFYVADRAVAYAMEALSGVADVVDLYNDQNLTVPATPTHRALIVAGQSDLEDSQVTDSDDRNSVIFTRISPPPLGSGHDVGKFKARNYAVHAVGVFPAGTNNPARTSVRGQYARIVPK